MEKAVFDHFFDTVYPAFTTTLRSGNPLDPASNIILMPMSDDRPTIDAVVSCFSLLPLVGRAVTDAAAAGIEHIAHGHPQLEIACRKVQLSTLNWIISKDGIPPSALTGLPETVMTTDFAAQARELALPHIEDAIRAGISRSMGTAYTPQF